jgi:Tol biopolymer transport system component
MLMMTDALWWESLKDPSTPQRNRAQRRRWRAHSSETRNRFERGGRRTEQSSAAGGRLRQMSARVAAGAVAVALLGVLLLAACAGSEGGEIEATGEIAFANTVGDKSAIFVVDAQGRSRRRITRPWVGHVRAVEWSPAGRRIAWAGFDAGVQGGDRLFVVNADGTGWRRPLTDGGDDWTLAWSPDGSTLAFDRNYDGPNWIYVVRADGRRERRVSQLYEYHPAWSPDGRIAYVTTRGVWVMEGDGRRKKLLARARIRIDGYPTRSPVAWSPDGRRVAFTTGTALWVMTADGSGRRRASAAAPPAGPVWSPDSTRIAFTYGGEIFVAEVATGDVRNLTDNNPIRDEWPTWSPDGKAIAFVSNRDGISDIYVMSADGGSARNVSHTAGADSSPTWSPPR